MAFKSFIQPSSAMTTEVKMRYFQSELNILVKSGDINFHRMSTTEDVVAKRQLKDIVGVIMQPDLNEPHVEPKLAYKSGISKDAQEYRDRNWGTLHLKGFAVTRPGQTETRGSSRPTSASISSDDTRVVAKPPRIVGSAALDNLRKSHGAMAEIIKALDKTDYTSERPPSRLPSSEAKSNEYRNRGTIMKQCLDSAENAKLALPKPQKKLPSKEAEENYHKNQGTIFREPSPKVHSRSAGTGNEPRGRALWNKGICAMVIAGKISGDPVPAIRVRGDGQDIYWHSHGSRTLLHHNPNVISFERQQSKDITTKVTGSFGRQYQSATAAASKRRPESRRYTRKYPASVADCLRRYL